MLDVILPIAVGGFIGYCTNYIAIKMLFRPRREIYIGKWKLPFTPGVIPKNQKRIAGAVANAVSEQLLTKDDLLEKIANDEMKAEFTNAVTHVLLNSKNNEPFISVLQNASDALSDEILMEIEQADFMPAIRGMANQALQDYLRNPMIAMFLNESMLESIYVKINESMKEYIHVNGKSVITNFAQKKIEDMSDVSLGEILDTCNIKEENIAAFLGTMFDEFVSSMGNVLVDKIDIKGIVTEKIESMKVEELEDLVMYVMKNELNMVINLGAVLGALIGIVNVFI